MNEKKNRISKGFLIGGLVFIVAAVGAFSVWYFSPPADYVYTEAEVENPNPLTGEAMERELPVRPIMVSTDNVGDAIPQYGISQADIVYEVPVEGAQSRLEAIYYGDIPDVVGPCRSVRPYIVDLAREYHAILTHDGWSPDAHAYLDQGVVADIPAQKYSFYYRTSAKEAPHNSLVHTEDVLKAADKAGYLDEKINARKFPFMNRQEQAVLSGTEEEYLADVEKIIKEKKKARQGYTLPDLSSITFPEYKEADTIEITYANCKSRYKYDSETGLYKRTVNGGEYKDLNNKKEILMSNVIVYEVSSQVLDQKGRLEINMCAGGKARIFTCGKVFKCKWSKKDLESPTVFKDEEGNEIKLAPGKTWINIIDENSKFKYE